VIDLTTAQGDRTVVVGRDVINSIIVTDDHSQVFTGDYERLRDAYIEPWSVFERVNLDHFVGREWLLREVDAFLRDRDRGYFVLEAEAGLGKTTFLAWLVRERGYIHHFTELVPCLIPKTLEEGEDFAQAAYRDGHEGVMAKDLGSAYTPGVRGKSWLKLKHTLSLDLVIVAADWGYGRRHGWLSNYHLAARDAETGEYLTVGKTFKGLTDAQFQEMTERLLALERSRKGSTVFVQPQVVVEVLFNEIQQSSQYQSRRAKRSARISRVREDKTSGEADTIQDLRQLYDRQSQYKGRLE
jgi:hypothetical protein